MLRLRALLRRTGVTTVDSGAQLVVGDLVLDEDSHEVMRAGEPVSLTSTEFELLRFMMHNSKRVLSKARFWTASGVTTSAAGPISWSCTSRTCAKRSTTVANP